TLDEDGFSSSSMRSLAKPDPLSYLRRSSNASCFCKRLIAHWEKSGNNVNAAWDLEVSKKTLFEDFETNSAKLSATVCWSSAGISSNPSKKNTKSPCLINVKTSSMLTGAPIGDISEQI